MSRKTKRLSVSELLIIGCGEQKQAKACKAKNLYTSSYFRLAREYAESTGKWWAICSAEHGVLPPDDVIWPYNKTLRTIDDRAVFRSKFRSKMLMQFEGMGIKATFKAAFGRATWDNPPTIVCFAGASYANEIRQCMAVVDVTEPLAGLQIGERQRWFKQNTPLKPIQRGLFA